MTDEAFSEGDTVRLKSGGPIMTFEGVNMAGQAICTWFEKTKKMTETFNPKSLQKANPSGGIGVFSLGRS